MEELRETEALQRSVWGEGDLPDPADLMMVIQAEGGLVAGAFVDGRLRGYVFGFPTRDPRVQHSHRLAVSADARGLGLGIGLKRYQRTWCLARGIERVRWTFDPLRARNAALNIHRLGATSQTYLVDYYGEMGGINCGLGSDRLLVDWDLASPAVTALARDGVRASYASVRVNVELPEDIGTLAASDPNRAAALRADLRSSLQLLFSEGYVVCDFDRSARMYLVARG